MKTEDKASISNESIMQLLVLVAALYVILCPGYDDSMQHWATGIACVVFGRFTKR